MTEPELALTHHLIAIPFAIISRRCTSDPPPLTELGSTN